MGILEAHTIVIILATHTHSYFQVWISGTIEALQVCPKKEIPNGIFGESNEDYQIN